MKIVFSSNISWSIYNFRLSLLKSFQKDGHEIYTVATKDDYSKKLIEEGFNFEQISLNNNSTNPLEDLKTIYKYYKLYKKIKPDVICHNAIKPNIYGTIAAGFLGIPTVNNISGLGTLFIKKSFTTKVAKFLYRFSQKRATKVFFQNSDDLNLFIENNLVEESKCKVIPGSGVDTKRFKPDKNQQKNTKEFKFLFIGRLLFDKGIREYVEAAKLLKEKYANVEFNVLGPLYANNSTSITQNDLDDWVKDKTINYLGETDKVEEEIKKVDCVVLPSYREGLSKVLIEASSMALPIVTTNVPGCKDVVVNNETGFLCEARSSDSLLLSMDKMLNLTATERDLMGEKARERAIKVFDQEIIINHYKNAIYSIV